MKVMLDPNLPRHPKVRKLAKALNATPQAALGYLMCLWCESMQQRENGVLDGWDATDIALASGWMGDDELFVKALVDVKWLDMAGATYSLHDWVDHQGDLIRVRELGRERVRRHRVKGGNADVTHGNADVTRYGNDVTRPPSLPLPSSPSPSLPIPPSEVKPPAPERKASAMNGSVEAHVVSAWNRGPGFAISHPQGQRLVRAFIDSGVDAQRCLEAVSNQPACKGKKIWEVLEPLRPKQDAPGVKSITQILAEFKG